MTSARGGSVLTIPDEIVVSVAHSDGSPVARALVHLDVLLEGRSYYGCLIGLTDPNGLARKLGQDVIRDFALDRELFPMDYKVPLGECDGIRVGITGGAQFEVARRSLDGITYIPPHVIELWLDAANADLPSVEAVIDLPLARGRADIRLLL